MIQSNKSMCGLRLDNKSPNIRQHLTISIIIIQEIHILGEQHHCGCYQFQIQIVITSHMRVMLNQIAYFV